MFPSGSSLTIHEQPDLKLRPISKDLQHWGGPLSPWVAFLLVLDRCRTFLPFLSLSILFPFPFQAVKPPFHIGVMAAEPVDEFHTYTG